MKQLQDIELQVFNKSKRHSRDRYMLSATIDVDGTNTYGIMLRGNDLKQLVWWIEWKLSHDLTDGEVSMDVQ